MEAVGDACHGALPVALLEQMGDCGESDWHTQSATDVAPIVRRAFAVSLVPMRARPTNGHPRAGHLCLLYAPSARWAQSSMEQAHRMGGCFPGNRDQGATVSAITNSVPCAIGAPPPMKTVIS